MYSSNVAQRMNTIKKTISQNVESNFSIIFFHFIGEPTITILKYSIDKTLDILERSIETLLFFPFVN